MPSKLSFRRARGKAIVPKKSNLQARDTDTIQERLRVRLERIQARVDQCDRLPEIPLNESEHFYLEDKQGRKRPFDLYPHQKTIIESINEDIRARKPCRIILLKPRQAGGSVTLAYATYYLATRFNLNAVIIGHKDTSSQNLHQMVKTFYNFDPFFSRGEVAPDKSNENIIRFPGGSRIIIATAGSKDAVTSTTNQIVLATEHALWPGDAGSQMRGLINTVSDSHPLTFVFIESTARPGTNFQDRWHESIHGKSTFKPIFIPWTAIDEYQSNIHDPRDEQSLVLSYNEDELRLANEQGASPEQLLWRRKTLSDKCRGVTYESKLIDFNSEYPESWEVAFASSEAAVFDSGRLNKMKENPPAPIFIGELMGLAGPSVPWVALAKDTKLRDQVFRSVRGGRLKIWEWPLANTQYVLGGDVAEGIEVGEYRRDNSAVTIRRQSDGFVVATWVGKMLPDDFADFIQNIGLFYNTAYVCVENNNMGSTTNLRLWRQYPKYAIYKSKYGADQDEKKRIGFMTTATTKNPAMMNLSIALKNEEFSTADMDLIQQMLECTQDSGGRIETGGKDLLMATVMSEVGRMDGINYNVAVEEVEKSPYDIWKAWRQAETEQGKLLAMQQ